MFNVNSRMRRRCPNSRGSPAHYLPTGSSQMSCHTGSDMEHVGLFIESIHVTLMDISISVQTPLIFILLIMHYIVCVWGGGGGLACKNSTRRILIGV